ncbi:MAG: 6-carboxytetrahydropterin synthase [Rubrobacter sp.]|nr:6-carboxytetrahydropterin synthase [Rubrobacter sp.]
MYRITKQFEFSASHSLDYLPPEHKCHPLHGHNYIVEVVLESPGLDENGFVRDYGELGALKDFIDGKLDHRHLNDVVPGPTTAENIARFLYDFASGLWPEVAAVRISETPKTWAEYRPEGHR